jgi:hypothetical protein
VPPKRTKRGVKLSLYLIKQHSFETYRRLRPMLNALLIWTTDGGAWLAPYLSPLPPVPIVWKAGWICEKTTMLIFLILSWYTTLLTQIL